MQLSGDQGERDHDLTLLKKFMAFKGSQAFTMAGEIKDPDGVFCLGVSNRETWCALSAFSRNPLRFSLIAWPDAKEIACEMVSLLPGGGIVITARDIAGIDACFGTNGRFPAKLLS